MSCLIIPIFYFWVNHHTDNTVIQENLTSEELENENLISEELENENLIREESQKETFRPEETEAEKLLFNEEKETFNIEENEREKSLFDRASLKPSTSLETIISHISKMEEIVEPEKIFETIKHEIEEPEKVFESIQQEIKEMDEKGYYSDPESQYNSDNESDTETIHISVIPSLKDVSLEQQKDITNKRNRFKNIKKIFTKYLRSKSKTEKKLTE